MSFAGVLLRRGERAARRAERRAAAEIAAAAAAVFDGVTAEADGGAVRLAGRGLLARAEADARLRWLGRWR